MTTAHTPGPWSVKEGHEHSEDCPLNVRAPDGRTVAAVVGMGDNLLDPATEEGHANARLITAAPDLLAALRAIVKLSDDMDPQGLFQSLEYVNARAAIAKAGG